MFSTFWLKSISYEGGSIEVVSFFLPRLYFDHVLQLKAGQVAYIHCFRPKIDSKWFGANLAIPNSISY